MAIRARKIALEERGPRRSGIFLPAHLQTGSVFPVPENHIHQGEKKDPRVTPSMAPAATKGYDSTSASAASAATVPNTGFPG